MKHLRPLLVIACSTLVGCDSKEADPLAPRPKVTSSDITGSWKVDYVSGTSHPMVGGVIELAEDGRMISHMPSGEKEEGKTATFWHLLEMESGDVIIALDSTFSVSSDFNPVLEQFEMPMAVVVEGDKMTWNLLTREEMKRASPSDKAAYKFTRK
jgi:hypothetical protein